MNKFYTYIIFIFGMFTLSFALGNKGKASAPQISQPIGPVELIIINDDSDDNTVYRRRGHKRKRKVRPRRNGF